ARGQRASGLARAGRAGEIDQVDVRIQQRVHGQRLEDVTRAQSPGLLMQQRLPVHVQHLDMAAVHCLDLSDETLFVEDEVVDMQRWQVVAQLQIGRASCRERV